MIDADAVAANVVTVRRRIEAAGGDPSSVTLVAVTKGFGPEAVEAALAAGVVDIGESYAQELVGKAGRLAGDRPLRWHFVGRLQSNKVRLVGGLVDLWQSLDRRSVIEEVGRRAPGARVLVQVNVSGEPQKGGCDPGRAGELVERSRAAGLVVEGLMAVGATGSPEASRAGFRRLADLADGLGVRERSMGMTGDLDVAVEEGATMVRVGRALFGARPGPRSVPGQLRD